MKRFAVIDLGTNTFHLVIVQQNTAGQLTEVHRERIYVRLAEEGIAKIGAAPFQRALDAMQKFHKILSANSVTTIKAFGTAALRTASNASEFISKVKATTGIQIDIIPGQEEARLIYLGVKQVVNFHQGHDLIMDIGGGSVEFIIANEDGVQWAESFPIGVAVLHHQFHKNEPISSIEIETLKSHLKTTLTSLSNILREFPVTKLIGASGTFDVLADNLVKEKQHTHMVAFPVAFFFPLHEEIVKMTLEERLQKDKLPASRADMIVVALLLIRYILELTGVEEIVVSDYAMKEGMLQEFAESR